MSRPQQPFVLCLLVGAGDHGSCQGSAKGEGATSFIVVVVPLEPLCWWEWEGHPFLRQGQGSDAQLPVVQALLGTQGAGQVS